VKALPKCQGCECRPPNANPLLLNSNIPSKFQPIRLNSALTTLTSIPWCLSLTCSVALLANYECKHCNCSEYQREVRLDVKPVKFVGSFLALCFPHMNIAKQGLERLWVNVLEQRNSRWKCDLP